MPNQFTEKLNINTFKQTRHPLPDNDEPGFKFMSRVATGLAHVV